MPRAEAPLPIEPALPDLRAALAAGHAVLTAPTGSGKTTRVPPALLEQPRDAPWLGDRAILMLEPRRPAARMAAAHMAAVRGEAVGETIGFQVRFERRIGPATRIQVLTEGILTRRIQADPELAGVGLIIFDEFHERSLQADLGLALALDAAALREDLRILVMSATLDADAVAALLGGAHSPAPIIRGEGRSHPVAVLHLERSPRDAVAATAPAIRSVLAEHAGDVLAFLPGVGEIDRIAADLGEPPGVEVLPLHGSLPLAAQERALRPARPRGTNGPRRVVLATDLAETSLTIEGIGVVVDAGLTRKPRFEPGPGMTRLVTQPIAQASAEQRAGRAGRLGPGHCLRLWTEADHRRRPAQRRAEILDADLAPLVLELALWGVSDPNAVAWLSPPPAPAWSQALGLLRDLGALDANATITPLGRRMATLPTHPRLAAMLCRAGGEGLQRACDLAALLAERDPWIGGAGQSRPVDLARRLAALAAYRDKQRRADALRGFEPRRLAAIDRAARQLQRLLRGHADAPVSNAAAGLLALAYPDRIAQNRGRDGRFLLASGTGAALPPDDPLAAADYLVVADLDAARGDHRIRAALATDRAEIETLFADAVETRERLIWDAERGAAAARRETRLGPLVLASQPAAIEDADAAQALLLEAIGQDLAASLHWTPAARQLQARVALARRLEPEGGWPDLSDAALAADASAWLGVWLQGKSRLADARALDLVEVLRALLGWERARRLETLAPPKLMTPAATERPIDYADPSGEPALKAPMQELFGATETPAIWHGRQPLTLYLLSPAGRPLQVTRDLAGFWRGAYAEVRKEMRGRYPKHHWPEDPAASPAVKSGLKRHLG
ncbi:ATP-dependent helicase HrpB [Thiohalocapsa halophila]|uniref:ATP-dependent helicase HrpB n=1 Tax=Thiohalocapsa halophila TaxID=69359 RepID=A0ABS1CC44_9GAMM|nr:ATP-dependent helicase HrpB [Thiohalocapsa halophila]MBK1629476.1 ATP-dependent helicase HrpB [Thiohalocapsa halophila]